MSDTPMTGALLESILRRDRFLGDKNAPEEWVVHARQLERELAVANCKIQRLVEIGDRLAMSADENPYNGSLVTQWNDERTAAKEEKL